MMSLGTELGGVERAKAMINGKGISLILKSVDVRFRRPVTFPDTVNPSPTPYLNAALTMPSLSAPYRVPTTTRPSTQSRHGDISRTGLRVLADSERVRRALERGAGVVQLRQSA